MKHRVDSMLNITVISFYDNFGPVVKSSKIMAIKKLKTGRFQSSYCSAVQFAEFIE